MDSSLLIDSDMCRVKTEMFEDRDAPSARSVPRVPDWEFGVTVKRFILSDSLARWASSQRPRLWSAEFVHRPILALLTADF